MKRSNSRGRCLKGKLGPEPPAERSLVGGPFPVHSAGDGYAWALVVEADFGASERRVLAEAVCGPYSLKVIVELVRIAKLLFHRCFEVGAEGGAGGKGEVLEQRSG